ncbi:MAG: glycosyltransferase, partial [Deinococcota bacterium]|nr:glycosyltransferase [Deinococcota bacterium]
EARTLELSLEQIVKLRSRAIAAALKVFKPDVLIVDNVPEGAAGELERVLKKLKKKGRTRCVLGLRDVLDDPKAVRKQWRKSGSEAIIDDYYDEVWVYGDPRVYDPVREYGFSPRLAKRLRYLGYFDQRARLCLSVPTGETTGPNLPEGVDPSLGAMVLCQVGGGQDGAQLALAFADTDLPEGRYGVLVTGPYMPPDVTRRLHELAASRARLKVLDFVRESSQLLVHAERVIAMGGYNTVFEVLSHELPLLLVPRVKPRREQLIRAKCLHDLGLLDFVRPDKLTPEALTSWLARDVEAPKGVRERLDFGAMARLPEHLSDLLRLDFVVPAQWEMHHAAT